MQLEGKIGRIVCVGCNPWPAMIETLTDPRVFGQEVSIMTDRELENDRQIAAYFYDPEKPIAENDKNLVSYVLGLPKGMIAFFTSGNLRQTGAIRLIAGTARFLLSQHSPENGELISISLIEKGQCREIYDQGKITEATQTAGSR